MAALPIDPSQLDEAAEAVSYGGVVVVPTETVYGLAALPNARGVDLIFDLKQRPRSKSLQVLAPDAGWLEKLGRPTPLAGRLAEAFWPGPLTLVVDALKADATWVAADGSVGVRVPNHPVALGLLSRTGPLAASSANPSGGATLRTLEEVRAVFTDGVSAYLDGGRIEGKASTVADVRGDRLEILRQGDIPEGDLRRAAGA